MADDTPVFLTDERRTVLSGEYDGADSTERAHRSNIRARSRTALDELIEVAASPEIDNSEVFDPDQVFRLLRALLTPRQEDLDDDEFVNFVTSEKYGDDFIGYADRLYVNMDRVMKPYRDGRFPDPETGE